MKSLQKKLLEAAELATSVGISNNDIESVDVHDVGTTFRLKPVALSRVFRENRVPKSKLKITDLKVAKEIYVSFHYRGVRWATFINREVMQEFKATIESSQVQRIDCSASRPRLNSTAQLRLPAPV